MDKIWKKALAIGGGVGVAVIIVVVLFLLLSNVTIRSTPASVPTQPPGGGGDTPAGANCPGNGHACPHGWANAACHDPPDHARAYGLRARCESNMTWGATKKAA
jgi:hypothetical protein